MTYKSLPDLFDANPGEELHPLFLACRDQLVWRPTRERLERAFRARHDLLPEGPEQFASEFRRNFPERSHELWLIDTLAAAGLDLRRAPPEGPDIKIAMGSTRLWIEAVVPGPGTGADRIHERPRGARSGFCYGEDQLILRYLTAISDKAAKLRKYRRKGIVQPSDRCLIALSQAGIKDSFMLDLELPVVVKAMLGIGEPVMVIDSDVGVSPTVEIPDRHLVEKRSGSQVATTGFLDGTADHVAGLLFVNDDVANLPWCAAEALRLLHNPNAVTPLPRGILPLKSELWVEQGELRHTGACAQVGPYADAPA